MCLRKMSLIYLICCLPSSLQADNDSSIDEALSRPVADGRLNMTIGVLGNGDGLTYGRHMGLRVSTDVFPPKWIQLLQLHP